MSFHHCLCVIKIGRMWKMSIITAWCLLCDVSCDLTNLFTHICAAVKRGCILHVTGYAYLTCYVAVPYLPRGVCVFTASHSKTRTPHGRYDIRRGARRNVLGVYTPLV